ncbi:response regulator transcription factor [Nocardiopsis sp. NPDC050513]|uniref:response regulator transcription factor n=1 Tax=Nocardiopsis sp. NPDC050513 TaxID=3364338 RepID=UPI003792AACC
MKPPQERGRVLLVDDAPDSLSMLTVALRFVGCEVTAARTGGACLELALDSPPDVIVIDVELPDTDGFTVCRRLREAGLCTPVLFLTAKDTSEDRLRGLELGDDYVTKPFDLQETVARIRALLRRTSPGEPARLRAGGLELDEDTRDVRGPVGVVHLSGTEHRVLRHLMRNAGRLVTKQELVLSVWGRESEGGWGAVETYVYNLRRKLGDTDRTLIRTVRGAGYVLQT